MTNNQKFALTAFLIVVLVSGLWLTKATPKDIEKCQAQTGWTADRCKHEINL